MSKEGDEEAKRTNEIKMAIPLLDSIDIQGKTITADALLTQREFALYLVEKRKVPLIFRLCFESWCSSHGENPFS
jgi:hypothetical protein